MNDLPEGLALIAARLDALEKRVAALELPSPTHILPTTPAGAPTAGELPPARSGGVQTSHFAVLGKAMLGIAGAYLLRAVAASGAVPGPAMAVVAVLYATGWLLWAARLPAATVFASITYAVTSAVILAPMLWEETLHFKTISAGASACVLAGFAAVATVATWRRRRPAVSAVAQLAAAAAALGLAVATHAMAPFLATLLALAFLCELDVARGHVQPMRPLVNGIADLGIWASIYVYSGPEGSHSEYPVLASGVLLGLACAFFVIQAGAIGARALALKQHVTLFEAAQALIAFSLAAASVLYFAPRSGTVVLGGACLVLSAACYRAAFSRFRRLDVPRNFNVFCAWGAGLLLAGTFWSMPPASMAVCMGIAAVAGTMIGVRIECTTLQWHGAVFLFAGAAASGLFQIGARALVGSQPSAPDWIILVVSACSVICYAISQDRSGEEWRRQVLHLALALLALYAVAALLAEGLIGLAGLGMALDDFHLAFLHSVTLCATALLAALGGSRWSRPAMTRMAYATLALMAGKLLFEDLRHGRMEFIAGSIFLFAITLMAVPRLARTR